jgi:hypothetical protein
MIMIMIMIIENRAAAWETPPLGLPWLSQTTGKLHTLKVCEYMC